MFALVTSTVFFWAPQFFGDCRPNSLISARNKDLLLQYDCSTGQHSPLGSMFFNEELGAIRSILSGFDGPGGIILEPQQMILYFFVWYFFMTTTYGVWVPAGLFLPGIIIGCAVGSLYENV